MSELNVMTQVPNKCSTIEVKAWNYRGGRPGDRSTLSKQRSLCLKRKKKRANNDLLLCWGNKRALCASLVFPFSLLLLLVRIRGARGPWRIPTARRDGLPRGSEDQTRNCYNSQTECRTSHKFWCWGSGNNNSEAQSQCRLADSSLTSARENDHLR